MKKLNKKGFTLVELLAVIVVLALIMVLTVPSVLTAMNSARQSTFLIYAGKMIESAQGRYQSQLLMGSPSTCFELKDLSDNGTTQYKGVVKVSYDDRNTAIFKIQMFDGSYQIGFKENSSLGDVKDGITYAQIETMKGNLASYSLQIAPSATDAATAPYNVSCTEPSN